MPLPFDARELFEVFARYNTAVWPAQIVLQLAALSAVVLAIRPRPGSDRAIGVILGSLWLWMGGVYHLVFFRLINPAASLFGALFLLEGSAVPTTIFTLGLLAWVAPPRPWSVLTIPLLWSAVGASAAVQLGVWEDLGLVAAGGLTLALTR
jgi:hypothetical protein